MFDVDISGVEDIEKAIKEYQGNAIEAINEVLHNEGSQLIQSSIRRLMPVSGAKWKGKKGGAKDSNSLGQISTDLAVTITTRKNYQYLYFPDDGTNTRRHIGNQQFFKRGAEAVKSEIVNKCLQRLTQEL